MVVLDDDVLRSGIGPDETDPPLVVDADAVLSRSIACQSLQPVPRWYAESIEIGRRVQVMEFSVGNPVDPGIELGGPFT